MKKDARLTIRIPSELKARLDRIHQIYGVAMPKIIEECLTAFCEYVDRKGKTPTFPILIEPAHAITKGLIEEFRKKAHAPSAVVRSRSGTVIHGINEPEGEYRASKKKEPKRK